MKASTQRLDQRHPGIALDRADQKGEGGSGFPQESGGGGGGGGGQNGGIGGGTDGGDGGSGGAGSSSYASDYLSDPSVSTAGATGDGYVVFVAIPNNTAYNNTATSETPPSGGGFNGTGNSFAATGEQAMFPAAVTVHGVSVPMPPSGANTLDNWVPDGQTLPVSGVGNTLAVVGAATGNDGAPVSGVVTVHYAAGTFSQITLTFANWKAISPAPGTDTVLANLPTYTVRTGSLFGAAIPLPADKPIASITLPPGTDSAGPALHIFGYAVGGPDNKGITDRQGSSATDGLFDGFGGAYEPSSLSECGLTPGAAVKVGPVNLTWPSTDPTSPYADNYTSKGQLVPLTGTGDVLAVIGAATNGDIRNAPATINYSDGSTQTLALSFADWAHPALTGTKFIAIDATDNFGNTGRGIFGATYQLDPGKHAISIRLPNFQNIGTDNYSINELHLFALGLGSASTSTASPTPGRTAAPAVAAPDVIVAPGDTLSALAQKHHISGGASTLLAQNKATLDDPDKIIAGQRLKIGGVADTGTVDIVHISVPIHGTQTLIDQVQASHLNSLVLEVHQDSNDGSATTTWSDGRPGTMTIINDTEHQITATATRGPQTRFTVTIPPRRIVLISITP